MLNSALPAVRSLKAIENGSTTRAWTIMRIIPLTNWFWLENSLTPVIPEATPTITPVTMKSLVLANQRRHGCGKGAWLRKGCGDLGLFGGSSPEKGCSGSNWGAVI
jgi:hypothetical protein